MDVGLIVPGVPAIVVTGVHLHLLEEAAMFVLTLAVTESVLVMLCRGVHTPDQHLLYNHHNNRYSQSTSFHNRLYKFLRTIQRLIVNSKHLHKHQSIYRHIRQSRNRRTILDI